MPRLLKVYRTPIGFHDAYVAVPTKKAAIEAWGAGSDIFQRGEAEEVTDETLTAEPLASPGVVIKRLRGSSAEHLAALGSTAPGARRSGGKPDFKPKPARAPKPKPRPSRAAVDEAEAAIAAASSAHQAELEPIAQREKALAEERRKLENRQRQQLDLLESELAKAESRYEAAMQKWRG